MPINIEANKKASIMNDFLVEIPVNGLGKSTIGPHLLPSPENEYNQTYNIISDPIVFSNTFTLKAGYHHVLSWKVDLDQCLEISRVDLSKVMNILFNLFDLLYINFCCYIFVRIRNMFVNFKYHKQQAR